VQTEKWSTVLVVAVVLALAVGGPWLIQQIRTLPGPEVLAARANQRVVTLEVGGMTCRGCSSAVRTRLAAVEGVSQVDVRLEPRRAYVVCDRSVPDTALTAAVQRAGPGFLAVVRSN
jgi:copper chaperone CopZ